jgi:ubiquinone/menaquinone biosynthesis C-methylase UbiE
MVDAVPGGSSDAAAARLATIAEAFSATASRYEAFAEDHPHLTRIRGKVYAVIERFVEPGSSVLELNAGTGTDAVHLAGRGFRIHATDIAPGMLDRVRDKITHLGLDDAVSVQECSYLDLGRVTGAPYDAVLSNLGGLNCAADLRPVVEGLGQVLRPGGVVIWVLMPPVCLWELALALSGQFRVAFRRLSRRGTRAHLEGRYFDVYYYTPHEVVAAFGAGYELLSIEGLSVVTPTAESKNLARRHPSIYRALCWLDDRVARHAPVSGWGDFFIVALRRRPAGQVS